MITEESAAAPTARSLEAAILQTAPDAIVAIDGTGRVVEWNPAATRILGYPRSEALGRPIAELIIPEAQREAHRRGLARYLATGQTSVLGHLIEVSALRADGSTFPAELTITAVAPPDEPPL